MAYEIVLTSIDLPYGCNPAKLTDELEAALGYGIRLQSHLIGDVVDTVTLTRRDGQEFSSGDEAIVATVASEHDPEEQTTEQWAEDETRSLLDGIVDRCQNPQIKAFLKMTPAEAAAWLGDQVEPAIQSNYPGTYNALTKMCQAIILEKDALLAYIVAQLRAEEE